ncbi:12002_t:CDS:2 [Acaulospora colombiana]|uniref:12002_t:CDS:1 n=1 Tax=Acaulospora colombiana TaxID=27376 RepID=A0ACA9LRB1_9GLOM|nr:12002_t:CDS:2 [Acaulospora colombiana]
MLMKTGHSQFESTNGDRERIESGWHKDNRMVQDLRETMIPWGDIDAMRKGVGERGDDRNMSTKIFDRLKEGGMMNCKTQDVRIERNEVEE